MADVPQFLAGLWTRKISRQDVPPEYRKQHRKSPLQLQRLYPDLVTSLDERGSRKAALQWWADLQAEIRSKQVAQPVTFADLTSRIKSLTKKERELWNKMFMDKLQPARAIISSLGFPSAQEIISDLKGEDDDLKDKARSQLNTMTEIANAALVDKLPKVVPAAEPLATNQQFKFWRKQWLEFKATKLKPTSMSNMPHHLDYLQEIVGADSDIKEITEDAVERFAIVLNKKIQAKEITSVYADNICRTIKPFIKYLAKRRQIALPLNLSDLSYKKSTPPPKPIPLQDARKILQEACGVLRCWLLLMFQSGYTQKDISDLKPAEVKWKAKPPRLERKRSKEEDEENVPTVNYLLWRECVQGLEEFGNKSGDRVFLHNGDHLIKGRSDKLAREFANLMERLGMDYSLKQIRKTTANLLYEVKEYGPYVFFYCGWSPQSVQDKHYLVPPLPIQDEMTDYLRRTLL